MNNEIVLSEKQIDEVKQLADETRKLFGVYGDVPIANDIFMLLEKKEIVLCQYPFHTKKESHLDANITWFETDYGPITFIGLNTSLYFDEQIFALAHELYHYITKSGKAYTDIDEEDKVTEKKADRFAAELLLPREALHSRVISQFRSSNLDEVSDLRLLRFVARLQNEWWLPYHSLVLRLYEEGYIKQNMFDNLFAIDDRDSESRYSKIFASVAPDCYKILNEKTERTGISNQVLEEFIQNYEDGNMTDDEFVELLSMFGKSPVDLGFDLYVDDDDMSDLEELFEGGGADES